MKNLLVLATLVLGVMFFNGSLEAATFESMSMAKDVSAFSGDFATLCKTVLFGAICAGGIIFALVKSFQSGSAMPTIIGASIVVLAVFIFKMLDPYTGVNTILMP